MVVSETRKVNDLETLIKKFDTTMEKDYSDDPGADLMLADKIITLLKQQLAAEKQAREDAEKISNRLRDQLVQLVSFETLEKRNKEVHNRIAQLEAQNKALNKSLTISHDMRTALLADNATLQNDIKNLWTIADNYPATHHNTFYYQELERMVKSLATPHPGQRLLDIESAAKAVVEYPALGLCVDRAILADAIEQLRKAVKGE